ncbi:MAG: metallophosphoesterase [Thermoplasmatota archaeon]
MNIQPIWNKRALKVEYAIVVADLHIGYESELAEKGVNLPSKTKEMIDSISQIIRENKARRLIINGDLKHNIPRGTWQEYKEIPEAIDEWLKIVEEVHIFKGNHDGGIERYLPSEVFVHDPSGAVIDGVGYFHGHAHPKEEVARSDKIIIAHTHPSVYFLDGLGRREKKPCWVKMRIFRDNDEDRKLHEIENIGKKETQEVVIMPHFNELLGGISINKDGYITPFLKKVSVVEEEVFLLDGTKLGELDKIDTDIMKR